MAVYNQIAVIKLPVPTPRSIGLDGIDMIILQTSPGINQAVIKLVCSDNNPANAKGAQDIEAALAKLNVIKTLDSHPLDPRNFANHSLQITANLDDPNIEDRFLKKGHATRIKEESLAKEQIKEINERYEKQGKKKLDEDKTTYKTGEVERG